MVQSEPRKKALIIAVSDYEENSGLKPLLFCKNDGEQMHETLNELGYEIMFDRQLVGRVDGNEMKDCVNKFFLNDDVKSEDTLLFYFSGHGVIGLGDFFLSSSNIDQRMPLMRGFQFSDLNLMMEHCKSKRLVVVLDCCYSGSAQIAKGDAQSRVAFANERQKNSKQGEGKCILSASLDFQESYATAEGDNSFFTHYLLKGLRGEDERAVNERGVVTPESLMRYIDSAIDEIPKEKRPEQTPLRKIETAGDIILATHSKFVKIPVAEQLKTLLKEGKVVDFNTLRNDDISDLVIMPERISKEKIIQKILNFSEINLSKKDLSKAILKFTEFYGANLESVILKEANLVGAEFNHSHLMGADLSNAVFHEQVIRPAPREAPSTGQSLTIKRKPLFTRLTHDQTRTVIGTDAAINDPDENDALNEFAVNFINCDLHKAKFIGINVHSQDSDTFCRLRFMNCQMSEVNFSNALLQYMSFTGLKIPYSLFDHADVSNASFTGADLSNASFVDTKCINVNFVGADLSDCDFTGANLSRSILNGSQLKNAIFKNADLDEVDLSSADLSGADFTNAKNLPISEREATSRGAVI